MKKLYIFLIPLLAMTWIVYAILFGFLQAVIAIFTSTTFCFVVLAWAYFVDTHFDDKDEQSKGDRKEEKNERRG